MNSQKSDTFLSVVLPTDLPPSPSTHQLINNQEQQDEEASDCPLLTPSPSPKMHNTLESAPLFNKLDNTPLEMSSAPGLENFNTEDGLNVFMNIVNSSSKPLNDEPSSRDPMVESTSSGSSSDTNDQPVCAQLLTQLNEAYQHLAPDAQALFYNQDNSGKPPLVGIQLVVPKPPKDYRFMKWNWPLIRKTCFWSFMSLLAGCAALVVGVIVTMPKRCDPSVEWWQGSVFYEIFPPSFQDSSKGGDGIGDLRGITMRLDYLKNLDIRGIRLNSIFPAPNYPEHYANITSLTEINPNLGNLDDFATLVTEIHRRNMSLILDLPLYPLVPSLGGQEPASDLNRTDRAARSELPDDLLTPSYQALRDLPPSVLSLQSPNHRESVSPNSVYSRKVNLVTKAIKTWSERGVDGFYLKGLEHYVHEDGFPAELRTWKSILGSEKILICSVDAVNVAPTYSVRNAVLTWVDLVDVSLNVFNGTQKIKRQVEAVTKGLLFDKPGYPWVHWSIGGLETKRIASSISVKNATLAIALMEMMLPGTPSIFYGDEIGIVDCDCDDHQDLSHLHNLVPMFWEKTDGSDDKFSSGGVLPWLPVAGEPVKSSLTGTVAEMANLRRRSTPIYVKAVLKENQVTANCEVKYALDEVIVIERWYPRRNSYVFVANFGNSTRIKDLSSLYYGGHVVVGPKYRLNRDVYFKRLEIPPGEAFVIKLDK